MKKTFHILLVALCLATIAYAQGRGDAPSWTPPQGCRAEVPALIHTTWDQGEPYYNDTPTDSAGVHARTGCIATSLAQILYYYQWPMRLTDGTEIPWKDMLPSYAGAYTDQQAAAVALLMVRCGKAVSMHYGTGVSLSYPKETSVGLVRDFGYIVKDYGYRDYPANPNYDEARWKEVVYRELSAGRPVLYGGTSYKHGQNAYYSHSFIIDGYDCEGRVHVNYGFSGRGDGYFDIDHLPMRYEDVDEEFDTYQTLVVIHRPSDGPITYDLTPLKPTQNEEK